MDYISIVLSALLTTLFIVFFVATVGYLVGAIKIKGISLGTAGVLLIALIVGILFNVLGKTDASGNLVCSFTVGSKTITLWNTSIKSMISFVSNVGTALFVSAVGLIAGPKFFRLFNKSTISYIFMGVIVIGSGVLLNILFCSISEMDYAMGTGLLTGALTSTPGLSAAKEAAGAVGEEFADKVTAGYGIGYLYGVLGVVLFVQIIPKILKIDIAKERESFIAANKVDINGGDKKYYQCDSLGFFPFCLTVVIGMLIGSIKIPISSTSYFSFGSSGGALIAGLVIGHFGHVGKIDLKVPKETLNHMRELGLMLFLIGAGIPGGVNFIQHFDPIYLLFGIVFTTVPMVVGFIFAKYVFKLSIFNNLGSITGGMTSTPALGSLIAVAGTDEVASAYAATYPVALVLIVISSNLLILFGL